MSEPTKIFPYDPSYLPAVGPYRRLIYCLMMLGIAAQRGLQPGPRAVLLGCAKRRNRIPVACGGGVRDGGLTGKGRWARWKRTLLASFSLQWERRERRCGTLTDDDMTMTVPRSEIQRIRSRGPLFDMLRYLTTTFTSLKYQ
jgi:hypothetical protein